jgi:hypothetical protein
MGQEVLVDAHVQMGEHYLKQLRATGFPVEGAFWAALAEESWYLYVVTPLVDKKGTRDTYTELIAHESKFAEQSLDGFDVRVVSPNDAMALAVAELVRPKPGPGPFGIKNPKPYPGMTRFNGSRLGGVDVEGALIYPPLS